MGQLALITIKGIFRDRVFRGIAMSTFFFLFIPTVSSLSMRQVVELSITLSLSLLSAILLILSVFLGGVSLWKDMERRYTFSILGLPMTRTSYLFGKFFGIAAFLLLATLFLGAAGCGVVRYVAMLYPPMRQIVWMNVLFSMFFIALKSIFLVAFAFLLSTVSTSFFLPIFGTLAVFFVGSSSQQVHDFLRSSTAQAYTPFIKKTALGLYYVLPNFSAFDLSVNAIYGIELPVGGVMLTMVYFVVYTSIILALSSILFARREMQ